MTRRNLLVLVIGVLVMTLGVAGTWLYITAQIGARTTVVVATQDIPAGAQLTPDLFEATSVQLPEAQLRNLIQVNEAAAFLGYQTLVDIPAGDFLRRTVISANVNPQVDERVALALPSADYVAVPLPVTLETAPSAIIVGDRVDLTLGIAADSTYGRDLAPATTGAAAPGPSTAPVATADNAATVAAITGSGTEPLFVPLDPATGEPLTVTPGTSPAPINAGDASAPGLQLPVAKTVLRGVLVLEVIRDTQSAVRQSPLNADGGAGPVPAAPIVSLVLAVPRDLQELLLFSIEVGTVRVAVVSPGAPADGPEVATFGMAWNDYVALLQRERAQALASGAPIHGPGASLSTPADPDSATQP